MEDPKKFYDYQRKYNKAENEPELKRKKNSQILRKNLTEIDEIRCLEDGNEIKEHANYCLIIVLNSNLSKQRSKIIKKLKELGQYKDIEWTVLGPNPNYKKSK